MIFGCVNMNKKFKLGVIGCGFMASAIINGAITSKVLNVDDIIVSDANADALIKMSNVGIKTTTSNVELVSNSEFVLFAIKPQNLNAVLEDIKDCKCDKYISIMAGVKKQKIKNYFKTAKVARCMPNTPCSIGYGAIGLDLSDFSDLIDVEFIKNLLSSLANVVCLEEDKLNAVTGISGSSPAYFYLFLKGIIESGVKQGLTYEDAKILATSTMIGAGKMVLNNNDKTLDQLIDAVCSKGGTTIEAVSVFNQFELSDITDKAIDACVKRAAELEKL